MATYYGQHLQDEFLEQNIFCGFRNGYFVDVGAHDGITINNTYFFEKERGWRGILVEPLPNVYKDLVKNRPNAMTLNVAIDDMDGTTDFIMNTGYTEMLSGIQRHYAPEHNERLKSELSSQGGSSTVVPIVTRRLQSIFDEHKVQHVHLLSIDVEGAEFPVIQSIDFDKVFIDVIVFEANYSSQTQAILQYLTQKDFVQFHFNGLDIFMVHKQSTFLKARKPSHAS